MNPHSRIPISVCIYRTFASFVVVLLAGACQEQHLTGTTTETISGKTTGVISLADGRPASSARVRLLPVGYRPANDTGRSVGFQTVTNKDGRFYIDSLATGEYNLISDLNGQAGIQDSVFLSGKARSLDTLSLSDPGILSGYVALESGDPPITVVVQVLGTFAFANVNAKGFFTLPSLPSGEYTVAVSTTLLDYTTGYFPITVSGGKRDTLDDTLRLPYSGIPQVTGLVVEYDTLNGLAHLHWKKSDYPYLKDYVVYRGDPDAVSGFYSAVSFIAKDTAFDDVLYPNPFDSYGTRSTPVSVTTSEYEYRVGIRNQFGLPGRTFGGTTLTTVTPAKVFTFGSISIPDFPEGRATGNDTVKVVVHFENRGRRIKRIRWEASRFTITHRVVEIDTHEGDDTLVFVAPPQPEYGSFHANLLDDGGFEWTISKSFYTEANIPVVTLTGPPVVSFGDSIKLSGTVAATRSRIVKWEWDFGAKGVFHSASGPDTLVIADTAWLHFPIVLRAIDEDGIVGADTLKVDVSRWRPGSSLPLRGNGYSAVLDEKIYYASKALTSTKRTEFFVYDPTVDSWESLPSPQFGCEDGGMAAGGGKLFLVCRNDHQGIYVYDPTTRVWETKSAPYYLPLYYSTVYSNGVVQILGGWDPTNQASRDVYSYNVVQDRWSNQHVNMDLNTWQGNSYPISVAMDSQFYAMRSYGKFGQLMVFSASNWKLDSYPNLNFRSDYPYMIHTAGGGKVFALVDEGTSNSTRLYVFDVSTVTWREFDPLSMRRTAEKLEIVGNRLFAIGDPYNTTGDMGRIEWIDLE